MFDPRFVSAFRQRCRSNWRRASFLRQGQRNDANFTGPLATYLKKSYRKVELRTVDIGKAWPSFTGQCD
jgi:hypothetical protein